MLEQSSAVTTAVRNQASDSCCDKKQAPFQGLLLLEEPLFFFKLNSCSSSGRKGSVHRQPCCQPGCPARSKAPAAHTWMPVPGIHQTQKYQQKQRHTQGLFPYIFSYTFSVSYIFFTYSLFITLQSFCSLTQAFNVNYLFLPSSVLNILSTFLFMDTPLCLCSVSDKKPTGLSQLVTTKGKKRDQLYFTTWFVSYNQSFRQVRAE